MFRFLILNFLAITWLFLSGFTIAASEPTPRFWKGLDSRIEWWNSVKNQGGFRAIYSVEYLEIDFENGVAKAPECRFDVRLSVSGLKYRVEIKAVRLGGDLGETVTWANVFGRDEQTAWMFDAKSGVLSVNSGRVVGSSNLLLPLLPEYSPFFPLMKSISDLRFDRDASNVTEPLEDFLDLPQAFVPSAAPTDPEKIQRKVIPLPDFMQGEPLTVKIRQWHDPGVNDAQFASAPFVNFRLELQDKPNEEVLTATYVGNPTYPSHSVTVMSDWFSVKAPTSGASIQLPRMIQCDVFCPDARSRKPENSEVLGCVIQSKIQSVTFGTDAEEFIMPVDQAAKIIDRRTGKPLAQP